MALPVVRSRRSAVGRDRDQYFIGQFEVIVGEPVLRRHEFDGQLSVAFGGYGVESASERDI